MYVQRMEYGRSYLEVSTSMLVPFFVSTPFSFSYSVHWSSMIPKGLKWKLYR